MPTSAPDPQVRLSGFPPSRPSPHRRQSPNRGHRQREPPIKTHRPIPKPHPMVPSPHHHALQKMISLVDPSRMPIHFRAPARKKRIPHHHHPLARHISLHQK